MTVRHKDVHRYRLSMRSQASTVYVFERCLYCGAARIAEYEVDEKDHLAARRAALPWHGAGTIKGDGCGND